MNDKMININSYIKSIYDSRFTYEQIAMLLDFYVTRSIAGQSGLSITLEDYGWKKLKNGHFDFVEIENKILESAKVKKLYCIRSNTIKDTLKSIQLSNEIIYVDNPKIVLQQSYSLSIDENENVKIDSTENRINCLFRHIRNSFAHANTYFFDDDYMLLEDKEKNKITARILIKQQTLLDWIKIIDKNQIRYVIKNA